jgi:hypothetical protein
LVEPSRALSAAMIWPVCLFIALLKKSDEVMRQIVVWVTPDATVRCSCTLAVGA